MKRPGPVVEVEWIDSHGAAHWQDREILDELPGLLPVISAGHLVREDADSITLALGVGAGGGILSPMAIPRVAITKLTRIRG